MVKKQISIILAPSWKFWISLEDRRGAIRKLGELWEDAIPAIPILINLLEQEDDESIRREAISALKKIGRSKSEVESAFINVFQDNTKGSFERNAALQALGSIKPSEKGIQVIASALSHHDPDTCFHSLNALDILSFSHLEKLRENNELTVPYLVNYAKQYRKGDCSRYVRSIEILSKLGDKGVNALIELLNYFRIHSEIEESLSYRIAEYLGSLGSSARSAVPALLDTLRDALQREDWQLLTKYYSDAIISIGYIDAVIDRYLQAKESMTPKFQKNLSKILFQLADKQQLIDYLKDQDHIKNSAALEVLHLRWTTYRPVSGYEQEREDLFQPLVNIFYRNDKDNRLLVLKMFVLHYTDEFPEKIEYQILELLDPIFTSSALDQKDSLCQAGCAGLLLLRTDHTKLISKIPHLLHQALMGEDKRISTIALSAISNASIQGEQGNTIVDNIVEYGETMTNLLDRRCVLDALCRIGPKANNSANFILKTITTALRKLEKIYRGTPKGFRSFNMPPAYTVTADEYFFAAKTFYILGKIRATKDITDKAFTMLKNSVWEKETRGHVAHHGIFYEAYTKALKEEIEN